MHNRKSYLVIAAAAVAFVSQITPLSAQITSINSRAMVGKGDAALVNEFRIQGSSRRIFMRGLGKSLAGPAVTNALENPVLELYASDGTLIIRNDDWQQAPNADEIEATGFAPHDPSESAILRTLAPGRYTVTLRGAQNTTGEAQSELYDADPGDGTAGIVAIGSRGGISSVQNSLLSGFTIGGASQNLLVRVLGKSLTAAGIARAETNPAINLFDSQGDSTTNDNWKATQQSKIQNSGLAPKNDLEAALIKQLAPGSYTLYATGDNATTPSIMFSQIYILPYSGEQLHPNPLPLQTEALKVRTVSEAKHAVVVDSKLYGDAGTQLSSTAVGSAVVYNVAVPRTGTYAVKVRIKTGPTRGKFQLAIDGQNQGAVQDEYTSGAQYQLRDLGHVTFTTAGTKAFRFTVVGKNPNSDGTSLVFDAINLVPQ